MLLGDAIQAVATQPASVNARATLAMLLEQEGAHEQANAVWEATVRAAAARGQFFPALIIVRSYIRDPDLQYTLLEALATRFSGERNRQGAVIPPPLAPPQSIEIPDDKDAQIQLAVSLGSDLSKTALPPTAQVPDVPIFGELSPNEFIALANNLQEFRFQPGTRLLAQGATDQTIYLLTHGKVRVTQERNDGVELELAEVSGPAILGEMAILTAVPRRASVTAATPGFAWRIDGEILTQLGESNPKLIDQLTNVIKARLLDNLLNTSKLFAGMNESANEASEERDLLLPRFDVLVIDPQQVVFPQDAPPPGLYVVLHGEAQVTRTQDGRAELVATLTEGDAFGEMSLLTNQPTSAAVSMPNGGVLLHLSSDVYRHLRDFIPHVEEELTAIMDIRRGDPQELAYPFLDHSDEFETVEDSWILAQIAIDD